MLAYYFGLSTQQVYLQLHGSGRAVHVKEEVREDLNMHA
jgi:hypothetical protein